uniref:Uncharacterized protein n=1 Tax=Anopheles farauti TaxID=69004 RepID=A0A182QDU8_9DIPT
MKRASKRVGNTPGKEKEDPQFGGDSSMGEITMDFVYLRLIVPHYERTMVVEREGRGELGELQPWIRIHVPIKHHTHLHTKTVVKTVHVGIPVKAHKGHDDEPGWEYGKKKKGASSYLSYL